MAQIDHSIYLQQQAPDFAGNILQGLKAGMSMRDLADKRALQQKQLAEEQGIKDAYKAGVIQNPDGTTSFDSKTTLSNLYKVNPQKAAEYDQQLKTQQATDLKFKREQHNERTDYLGRAYMQMKKTNGQGYQALLADAKSRGYDISTMPPVWGPDAEQQLGYHYGQALTTKEQIDQLFKEKELASKALDRKEARDERRMLSGIARQDRQDQRIDSEVQKLSKDLAGTQDVVNALNELEGNLGFKIDEADASGDTLKVNGKTVDLPGASLPGIGRTSFYSDKAQRLQSSASKVFNSILKDRSGATVTTPELERLKIEFGEGKFNTEPQMVDALQRYQRAVRNEMRNREAAYSKSVVNRYADQGGATSKAQSSKTQQTPIFKTSDIEW